MNWIESINTFHKVIEENSFAGAARKLHTTSSAISKRIKWLEDQLQAQLLERTTRKLHLTDTGKNLYQRTHCILEEWENIKQETQQRHQTIKGRIRIGSSSWFCRHVLYHFIEEYMLKHNQVCIELLTYDRTIDLHDDELDIAITGERFVHDHKNLQKIKIGTICKKLYAAQSYIKKYGQPTSLDDLNNHALVTAIRDNRDCDIWELNGIDFVAKGKLRSNDSDAMIQAVMAGLGITYLSPSFHAKIYGSKIINVLPQYQSRPLNAALFYSNQRFISFLLEDFIDFLVERTTKWFSEKMSK